MTAETSSGNPVENSNRLRETPPKTPGSVPAGDPYAAAREANAGNRLAIKAGSEEAASKSNSGYKWWFSRDVNAVNRS